MFVREICAAAMLIILTLWLQCGGIATLITWFRGSMAGDIEKFGLFRTAVLIVRFTTAVVVLHLIEALVWAIFYRWFCLPSWEAALYFSAGSYGTVGCSDVSLPPNWRALGPLESITGALMCGISVSLLFATIQWLIHRGSRSSHDEAPKPLRANPGPEGHSLVNGFNQQKLKQFGSNQA
jgi:voltage-gated potassium channel